MNGGSYFSNDLVSYYNNASIHNKEKNKIILTSLEDQVLNLLCKGFSLNEIAVKLAVSNKIIEAQCNNLSAKTNTRNAVGLVLFAIKNKMVTI